MSAPVRIKAQVLEQIHYIHFPDELAVADLVFFESKTEEWAKIPVELHVLDLRGIKAASERFIKAVKALHARVPQGHLVSLNLTAELQREVARLKLDAVFTPIHDIQELTPKKQFSEDELRRLLIRYLIHGAYSAVEVALNSTVSCDENYLARAEKVPFHEFDLVTAIEVSSEFLNAQIRLCASTEVLKRLATRMLGGSVPVESEMIESMALELLNLIYGHAKSHLNDKEHFRLPPAIPRLLAREQLAKIVRGGAAGRLSILPLVTPMGSIYVEVDIP